MFLFYNNYLSLFKKMLVVIANVDPSTYWTRILLWTHVPKLLTLSYWVISLEVRFLIYTEHMIYIYGPYEYINIFMYEYIYGPYEIIVHFARTWIYKQVFIKRLFHSNFKWTYVIFLLEIYVYTQHMVKNQERLLLKI